MTAHLLDANVLIALSVAEHEHHGLAVAWASTASTIALCPIVEGALVRFLVRLGESATTATELLRGWYAVPGWEHWPDDLSYVAADLAGVGGHRQVTDAYLVALASSRQAVLATFDRALAASAPHATLLVPGSAA